jgi:predicted tellurium resistance membrane protein TerC
MIEMLMSTEFWLSLATLTALEIVLGVDNLVFIALVTGRLPPDQRKFARRFGLALACGTRIALLLSLAYLSQIKEDIFSLFGMGFSVRDLVLILGGAYLVYKGIKEMHDAVEGEDDTADFIPRKTPSFGFAIAQIAVIDIVFSLDSVITAVGIGSHKTVMVLAIIIAVAVMIFFSEILAKFIEDHPTVKILALSFLVLVGSALVVDGFGIHVPRGYLYFSIAFSVFVEVLNIRYRKRRKVSLLDRSKSPV